MITPRTNQTNGGYDETLLAAAPEASKAAKQEGYNVDLLDEPRPARGTTTPRSDPEAGRSKENYNALRSTDDDGSPRRVPFWRTRGGIIGLAILAIVIIGAVVGGAVGGTVGKNKNNKPQQAVSPAQTGSGSPSQGQAPVSSSSGTGAGAGTAPVSSTPADPNGDKSQAIGSSSSPPSPPPAAATSTTAGGTSGPSQNQAIQ